jgi:hypothetical protein
MPRADGVISAAYALMMTAAHPLSPYPLIWAVQAIFGLKSSCVHA